MAPTTRKGRLAGLALGAACALASSPAAPALADAVTNAGEALASVMSTFSRGVQFIGALLVIWGLIQVGLMLNQDGGGGGGRIVNAILTIVAGVIVFVGGTMLANIDTSWATVG